MEQNQRNKDLLHAELLLNQSRWAEAEKAFGKLATVHYQDDGDMQYYWAFSIFRQERTDEAEAMTLTALKRFPNVVPLHILLGQIKLERQETWFAIRHFASDVSQ